jgi:Transglycosylase
VKRAASRAWRIALLLGAATQPWCEAGALEHAQRRLATRGTFGFADWDLDVRGLQLRGVEGELRGNRVGADEVAISLAGDGVLVEVRGLSERGVGAIAAEPATEGPASAVSPGPQRSSPPSRLDTHGIAIHVRAEGTLALPLGDARVAVVDPALDLDASGTPTLRMRARIDVLVLPQLGGLVLDLPTLMITRDDQGWIAEGTATIDDGPALQFSAERPEHGELRVVVGDAAGGRLELDAADRSELTVVAEDFALAGLGPRWLARARARGIGLAGTRVDGTVALERGEGLRIHADALTLRGLEIDDRRLAPRTVVLDTLTLDGDIDIRGSDRLEAQLLLGHREAQLAVAAALHGDSLRVELELAELGCTELLAAVPSGMADVLGGARLSGTIDGRASLAISFEALARARARDERAPDGEPEPPPGELDFEFDFLERCRTLTPPASVDLEGLRGPWRHRFLGDDGHTHERMLAAGAIDYAPLGRVSRLAEAFIALEDMRYWYHDGFDREQIERAFWHNLKNGRVRRGASTISQQAARNLWLGVDRSLARKLQEAYLTALLEAGVSKSRILELYLNLVELGPGIYGVDAAARHHFGVPADQLDVLQAIHIAALAPAPRTLSDRFASGEVDDAWLAALRDHARRMYRNHMITPAELQAALRDDLRLVKH